MVTTNRQHSSFPALFIYGHTSSGKTYVVQILLKTLELPHVFVNCAECFTSKLLLEEMLRQLQCLFIKEEDHSFLSCDTLNDF
ncbi:Origin recognition complex subunit 5, partial [Ophiophagus hannah]